MISKAPRLLVLQEELVGKKLEYLIKETGCDKIDVVQNPVLLIISLENRLIPRSIVRKLLQKKGLPMISISYFMKLTEEQFVKKFVLPASRVISN